MDTLAHETLALREKYDEEPSHSDHVALLALQLFDGLQPWHKFSDRTRKLIHSAALLHDIGWSQTPDGKGHHKESARLIREHAWKNFSSDEIEAVALIARYHRKTPPEPDHAEFHALKPAPQRVVMILGGILRIADALDRTHTGKILRVDSNPASEAIYFEVKPAGNWEAERAAFNLKRDMLQTVAKRPALVKAAD